MSDQYWDEESAARRMDELETQLAKKTAEAFQWIDEALRIGELNAKHVGEIRQLKEQALELEAAIWKQVVEEWEKPWGLSSGESFEVRMRRKAGK